MEKGSKGNELMLKNIARKILKFYRLKILKDSFFLEADRWFRDNGDYTLRIDYPLNSNSVILDVGAYKGEWAELIIKRYNPHIYVFEPVPSFYENLVKKFENNPKIKLFNVGLADRDSLEMISLSQDGSSIYHLNRHQVQIRLIDIKKFLEEEQILSIDLIKINIEGGEYPLLSRMIELKLIERCQDIQVQFHNFIPDAQMLRLKIRETLEKTHYLTYDYSFIWENWTKK